MILKTPFQQHIDNINLGELPEINLILAFHEVHKYHRKLLSKVGCDMTLYQWQTLVCLWPVNFMNQTDIAFEICKDKGYVTRMIRDMKKKNWVKVYPSWVDHRVNDVSLTDLGKNLKYDLIPLFLQAHRFVFNQLSKSGQKSFCENLYTMKAGYSRLNELLK